jgi:ribosome assembly protein RRB1
VNQLGEGETLEYDSRAYDLIHFMQIEWPCLSFDLLRDGLGYGRQRVRT